MKQTHGSPFNLPEMRITKLSPEEYQEAQELALDPEATAIWGSIPSFTERFQRQAQARQEADHEN